MLVEGESDRIAVTTIARRLGRDLATEGVEVRVLGGATNLRRHVREALVDRVGWGISGLYDVAEHQLVTRALADVGLGPVDDALRLEQLGFFACVDDLEDEMIRAVGERRMVEVMGEHGDLGAFRRFQRQPLQRDWSQHRQLHRFVAARAGYKARYARLLAEAVPLDAVPRPIAELLART